MVSLFYHNEFWYFSTKKNIYKLEVNYSIDDFIFNSFLEIINTSNIKSLDSFLNQLDKNNNYHFDIIDYKNKRVINYTSIFGKDYKILSILSIKDKYMNELEKSDFNMKDNNFILPTNITLDNFLNSNSKLSMKIECEGVIIKKDNIVIKLQSDSSLFYKYKNINLLWALFYLYKENKLNLFQQYKKRIYAHNIGTDITYICTCIFKCLTHEFLYFYKTIWNKQHRNDTLYNSLPKIYKSFLYIIRGMKNKSMYNVINELKLIDINQYITLFYERNSLNELDSIPIDNNYTHYKDMLNLFTEEIEKKSSFNL